MNINSVLFTECLRLLHEVVLEIMGYLTAIPLLFRILHNCKGLPIRNNEKYSQSGGPSDCPLRPAIAVHGHDINSIGSLLWSRAWGTWAL